MRDARLVSYISQRGRKEGEREKTKAQGFLKSRVKNMKRLVVKMCLYYCLIYLFVYCIFNLEPPYCFALFAMVPPSFQSSNSLPFLLLLLLLLFSRLPSKSVSSPSHGERERKRERERERERGGNISMLPSLPFSLPPPPLAAGDAP